VGTPVIYCTKGDGMPLVKDFGAGMTARANKSMSAVAIFADMNEGQLFQVCGWTKHPDKSLDEIADLLWKTK